MVVQGFNQLSTEFKHILNADKAQIPTLSIKIRRSDLIINNIDKSMHRGSTSKELTEMIFTEIGWYHLRALITVRTKLSSLCYDSLQKMTPAKSEVL